MKKSLADIHNDVSAYHYDIGFKSNIFQKYWHNRRIFEIKKLLPKNTKNILDVGCHSGFLTYHILQSNQYSKLTGIDISKEAIAVAKIRFPNGKFIIGDAHSLPFASNSFATVFCFEALEHTEDPQKILQELKRVTNKNGSIYILIPTDTLLFRGIWTFWNIIHPVWKHAHVQSFRSDTLVTMVKKEGLHVESIKYFNLGMLLLIKVRK